MTLSEKFIILLVMTPVLAIINDGITAIIVLWIYFIFNFINIKNNIKNPSDAYQKYMLNETKEQAEWRRNNFDSGCEFMKWFFDNYKVNKF